MSRLLQVQTCKVIYLQQSFEQLHQDKPLHLVFRAIDVQWKEAHSCGKNTTLNAKIKVESVCCQIMFKSYLRIVLGVPEKSLTV